MTAGKGQQLPTGASCRSRGLDLQQPIRGCRLPTVTVAPLERQARAGNSPGPAAASPSSSVATKVAAGASRKAPRAQVLFSRASLYAFLHGNLVWEMVI